jgi:hypothetical protein
VIILELNKNQPAGGLLLQARIDQSGIGLAQRALDRIHLETLLL